jgi:hypothetical protein
MIATIIIIVKTFAGPFNVQRDLLVAEVRAAGHQKDVVTRSSSGSHIAKSFGLLKGSLQTMKVMPNLNCTSAAKISLQFCSALTTGRYRVLMTN